MVEMVDPELPDRLEALVEAGTRGDPESPLSWTSKSTRMLAAELTAEGRPISYVTVAAVLRSQHYCLQGNRKTVEGDDHPDRDAQFLYINDQVRRALAAKRPVISVDTKTWEEPGRLRTTRPASRPCTPPPGSARRSSWPFQNSEIEG
ncbi:MAG: ISAzo13-like element transposase-related protein [Gemmatimonadaceae bacterium]